MFTPAGVTKLESLSNDIAILLAAITPSPVPVLAAGVVLARKAVYTIVAGDGELVLASPWVACLALIPIKGQNMGYSTITWTTYKDLKWNDPAKFFNSNYTKSKPALAIYNGNLFVLHQGAGDDGVWHIKYDPDYGWGDSIQVPNIKTSAEVGAYEYRDNLHMVYRGQSDSTLYHIRFNGQDWFKNTKLNNMYCKSGPALAEFQGNLILVARGTENKLWYNRFDGSSWHQYKTIGDGSAYTSAGPALVVFEERLYCVARGMENYLWWTYHNGNNWSNYRKVADFKVSSEGSLHFASTRTDWPACSEIKPINWDVSYTMALSGPPILPGT